MNGPAVTGSEYELSEAAREARDWNRNRRFILLGLLGFALVAGVGAFVANSGHSWWARILVALAVSAPFGIGLLIAKVAFSPALMRHRPIPVRLSVLAEGLQLEFEDSPALTARWSDPAVRLTFLDVEYPGREGSHWLYLGDMGFYHGVRLTAGVVSSVTDRREVALAFSDVGFT